MKRLLLHGMSTMAGTTPEHLAAKKFESWLVSQTSAPAAAQQHIPKTSIDWKLMTNSSFATFLLHVRSRQAALEGEGFYTIGPCGEEFASCWGALLRDGDTASFHYRHVAAQIARQLVLKKPLDEIILDRCRGFVCSTLDPVTGGRHCAIGGVENIFYNTSTLASQAPAAVGRALAGALLPPPTTTGAPIHLVTLGDGSANNAAFLAAKNLAENAAYKKIKCPVLFCITDNDLSISLKQHGYIGALIKTFQMPVYHCNDGSDFAQVYLKSAEAFAKVRETQKPALLVVRNVLRRFGHAATDRQLAYLTAGEIDLFQNDDSLLKSMCNQANASGQTNFKEMLLEYQTITRLCDEKFAVAAKEPKLDTVKEVERANQAPLDTTGQIWMKHTPRTAAASTEVKLTMRKCMTTCIEEQMQQEPTLVYMGEDVRHGGYYLVTEGLAKRFPKRVLDFPPDETNLIGCAIGFAQRGLLPLVELPYLKYLDCGADQFFEACMMHWITNGTPKQNGIIFRLQGFDRGKFGGNFHTHNSLYLPPGLDVLCFSNGEDWIHGLREAVQAAKQGRMVAIVDSTHALTKRHLFKEGDDAWMVSAYPLMQHPRGRFQDITCYLSSSPQIQHQQQPRAVIVTYGNGVPDALVVQQEYSKLGVPIDVIDCPLLSQVPDTLVQYLDTHAQTMPIVFADCCKLGQNPFGLFVQHLQSSGHLPARRWGVVAAPATYNPLGRMTTFLNADLIRNAVEKVL